MSSFCTDELPLSGGHQNRGLFRVACRFSVAAFRAGDTETVTMECRNISGSGMYALAVNDCAIGLDLRVVIPAPHSGLSLSARVVRTVPVGNPIRCYRAGLGIRFVHSSLQSERDVIAFVMLLHRMQLQRNKRA